jgi:F0F1-type ATP synthase membrane subunit c/vacuolar-type H+-ATPase subunit K
MFEGLSRQEIIGWLICLILAVGLTIFGSAYLATSYLSADVSSALKRPESAPQIQKGGTP